ncbi:hypothetical protein DFS33DRAFT_1387153 [Desarmillaria ectypa]|nr:hypothetical protein DFS33DRAFT_1387153 [Desarmillaria ectypa]
MRFILSRIFLFIVAAVQLPGLLAVSAKRPSERSGCTEPTTRVTETWSLQTGSTYVDELLVQDTLAKFKNAMFHGLHQVGHKAIGGEMGIVMTSPKDPMFWMHHGYVDHLWWKWQGVNETGINDLEGIGYESQREPDTGYVVQLPFDILPNVTVADMLDTEGGFLCYTYT